MATSSKVEWRLETLREEALKAIDERIATKVLEVEQFGDPVARLGEWRSRQVERVEALFRQRLEIPDTDLAAFRVEPMPQASDDFGRMRAERELSTLQTRRAQMVAKTAALVPDESGNISLTKTQLAEFFDL